MTHAKRTSCLGCGSRRLFKRKASIKIAGHLLIRLRGLWRTPRLDVVVCGDCGHVSLLAGDEERRAAAEAPGWERVRG